MSESCEFCHKPLNPFDEGTYKQVTGWVHGKKSDGMVLREYTGKYAHQACIQKQVDGQPVDQPELFNEYLKGRLAEPEVKAGFDAAESEEEELTLLFIEEAVVDSIADKQRTRVVRCDQFVKKGTGSGLCDTLLDELGLCPNSSNHEDLPF